MTREEAIAKIKHSIVSTRDCEGDYIREFNEALEIAIKALEQEPCNVFDEYGNYKYPSDVELTEPNMATSMPCEDAISRQAVIDMISDAQIMLDESGEYCGYCTEDIDIESIPSVTPQPKTGHWQHYEGMLICSECGTEFYDDIMEYCGDDVPKCCPNCGCRMVEPQERSDKG